MLKKITNDGSLWRTISRLKLWVGWYFEVYACFPCLLPLVCIWVFLFSWRWVLGAAREKLPRYFGPLVFISTWQFLDSCLSCFWNWSLESGNRQNLEGDWEENWQARQVQLREPRILESCFGQSCENPRYQTDLGVLEAEIVRWFSWIQRPRRLKRHPESNDQCPRSLKSLIDEHFTHHQRNN